jgi:hypothetical protein
MDHSIPFGQSRSTSTNSSTSHSFGLSPSSSTFIYHSHDSTSTTRRRRRSNSQDELAQYTHLKKPRIHDMIHNKDPPDLGKALGQYIQYLC